MLGYYFVSHELLNNKSDNEIVDNNKDIEEKEDNEEKEIEYTFDADKIINKDTTYRYSLASENKNANAITDEKTTNGYKLCCKGSCKEILMWFLDHF